MPLPETTIEVATLLAFEAYLEAAPDAPTFDVAYGSIVETFINTTYDHQRFEHERVLRASNVLGYRKDVLVTMLSLKPPLPYVEACIAASITTRWRGREKFAADIVIACITHNRWRFLDIFLTRSGLDVNYKCGLFIRKAIHLHALDCLKIFLEHKCDISSSATEIECLFYEGSECAEQHHIDPVAVCRSRKMFGMTHTIRHHRRHVVDYVALLREMTTNLGEVHFHGEDVNLETHHPLLTDALLSTTHVDCSIFRIMLPYASNEMLYSAYFMTGLTEIDKLVQAEKMRRT